MLKMMKMSHVKEYFRETTVHGLRYVVDGKTIAERLMWAVVMICAFFCASYLIHSSIIEAEENPIATTIEVLTVDDIPFPSVTVVAGGRHEKMPPFRLVIDILNTLSFDCTRSYDDCQPTERLREHFMPFIRNTIKAVYHIWLRELSIDSSAADWIKKISLDSETYASQLINAFCNINGTTFGGYPDVEESVLTLLQENFMVNQTWYMQNTLSYLQELNLEITESDAQCNFETIGSLENKAVLSTMLLLNVKARQEMPNIHAQVLELGLGNLLALSYYSMRQEDNNDKSFNLDQPLSLDGMSQEIIIVLDDIVRNLLGNDDKLSTVDVYNVMARHVDEIKMTSAENYASKILPGKLSYDWNYNDDHLPGNYSSVLKAMKYARQGGSTFKTIYNEDNPYITDVKKVMEGTDYTRNCGKDANSNCLHSDPVILASHFGAYDERVEIYENCDVFSPIITQEGLAYSFNSTDIWNTFLKSKSVMGFEEEYFGTIPPPREDKYCIADRGIGNQLQFILRQTNLDVLTQTRTPFKVAIHSPNDLPEKFMNLLPGYKYTITVTPEMISSDPKIGQLPLSKRGCQPDTVDYGSEIFNTYSFAKCLYEGKLKESSLEMKCQPWDQQLLNNPTKICDRYDASVIVEMIKSTETEGYKHCIPDCNSTTYTYSVRQEKLEDCSGDNDKNTIVKLHPLLAFLSDAFSIRDTIDGIWLGACQREQSHQAQVTVEFATNTVTNIRRIRRTTFTDQMASLGGVVGLFTGMSFLSIVELLVWILRWVIQCSKRIGTPTNDCTE